MPDHRNKDDITVGMSVMVAIHKYDPPEKWIPTIVKEVLTQENFSSEGIKIFMDDFRVGYCKEIIDGFVHLSESTLEKLIEYHETIYFELKSSFRWSVKYGREADCLGEQIVREVGAFMNAKGGKICIGITNLGEVLGLENDYSITSRKDYQTEKDAFLLRIRSYIRERLKIPLAETLYNPYVMIYKQKHVCIIDVKESNRGIFVLEKYNSKLCDSKDEKYKRRVFYVRTGQGVVEYSPYDAKKYWDGEKKTDFL